MPAFAGPPYGPQRVYVTPAQLQRQTVKEREGLVASLAFHRLRSARAAAVGNVYAASWHREQAGMYARRLRRRPYLPAEPSSDLREEIASWSVAVEVMGLESHLTAEDYFKAGEMGVR